MPEPRKVRPAPRKVAKLLLPTATPNPRRRRAEKRPRVSNVQTPAVSPDRPHFRLLNKTEVKSPVQRNTNKQK